MDGATPIQAQPATIPASIVQAICKVQASIEAVAKSQYNKQGNYKFASTDDIYASVARKLGESGLLIYPMEMAPPTIERVEKEYVDERSGEKTTKISQWGKFCFGYVLATAEATWFDPRSSRTIFIQLLGPQSFNAAESYCQKQYLRSLLKMPTGDMDLDGLPEAETEEAQVALVQPAKRKSSYAAKKDGKSPAVFDEINRHILGCHDAPSLRYVRETYATEWAELPTRWAELLDGEYETRMASFGEAQAAE